MEVIHINPKQLPSEASICHRAVRAAEGSWAFMREDLLWGTRGSSQRFLFVPDRSS